MTPQEIGKELEELESRLERLRIKYELYFQGIEKLMPFVPRKDVERRFTALHKEPIRNASLRFRFNTLVQRWTSYQTHWGRILRQIEEGTYKRDVLRAKKLIASIDRRERAKVDGESNKEKGDDVYELADDELLEDGDSTSPGRLSVELMRETIDLPDFGEAPARTPLQRTQSPREAPPQPDGFMQFDRQSTPPAAATPTAASQPAATPTAASQPAATQPAARPAVTPGPGRIPMPGQVSSGPTVGAVKPGASPFGALRAPTPAPTGAAGVPRPLATPAGGAPAGASRPVPMPGAVAPRPAASPLPPPRVVTPGPAPSTGEDPAMRALYQRYVDARKQTGESVEVKYESVARQVRESLPKLSAQYQGADVKFDVSIKDGKAVLRPVVTLKKNT